MLATVEIVRIVWLHAESAADLGATSLVTDLRALFQLVLLGLQKKILVIYAIAIVVMGQSKKEKWQSAPSLTLCAPQIDAVRA